MDGSPRPTRSSLTRLGHRPDRNHAVQQSSATVSSATRRALSFFGWFLVHDCPGNLGISDLPDRTRDCAPLPEQQDQREACQQNIDAAFDRLWDIPRPPLLELPARHQAMLDGEQRHKKVEAAGMKTLVAGQLLTYNTASARDGRTRPSIFACLTLSVRNASLPPPALREYRHSGFARGFIAVCGASILVVPQGQRPHHGDPSGAA
jgi:hypothetical protein